MTRKNRSLNEDPLGTLSSRAKSLYNTPMIQSLLSMIDSEDEPKENEDPFYDTEQDQEGPDFVDNITDYIEQIAVEKMPLKDALNINPAKKALIIGSSQAGVQGEIVMRLLEAEGFVDFNYKAYPGMRLSEISRIIPTSIVDKDEYDVVIVYPGFKSGEDIDSITDLIQSFDSPARCFVVLPPPVTTMSDTTTAAALGLNNQNLPPDDYWFRLRGGSYVAEREEFSQGLKDLIEQVGSTAIDPRDINFSDSQPQTLKGQIVYDFPDMPDGIHPTRDMAKLISKEVVDAIFNCTLEVTTGSLLSKLTPTALQRTPEILKALSDYPAASAIASHAISSDGSAFGMRMHPTLHVPKFHQGIDIRAPMRTPVKAVYGGTVTFVSRRPDSVAGNFVEIKHPEKKGVMTRYLHLDSTNVNVGQTVAIGDVIGLSGKTGRVTGPHLHFEVWPELYGKGRPIDPKVWLAQNTDAIKPISFI